MNWHTRMKLQVDNKTLCYRKSYIFSFPLVNTSFRRIFFPYSFHITTIFYLISRCSIIKRKKRKQEFNRPWQSHEWPLDWHVREFQVCMLSYIFSLTPNTTLFWMLPRLKQKTKKAFIYENIWGKGASRVGGISEYMYLYLSSWGQQL